MLIGAGIAFAVCLPLAPIVWWKGRRRPRVQD